MEPIACLNYCELFKRHVQRYIQILSSETLCRWMSGWLPDVSKGHIASIFMLKQSNKTLLVQLDPTDEGTTFSGQVGNHLANVTAFHRRRYET
jgi:hypothetical protein